MPIYYTSTKNPIARAGIIRKLLKKGYKLPGNYTVSDYFRRWPAIDYPVVAVYHNAETWRNGIIDLTSHASNIVSREEAIKVSPVTLKGVPDLNPAPVPAPTQNKAETPAPVFPEAAKYSITYTKANGSVGNYTISNPIEANNDSLTAYAFGRGVRTFKKAQIRSFSKVS